MVKDAQKIPVLVENVETGDIIEIKAGEKIVIDGKIVSGSGSFDESSLTGESVPVFKKEGDDVLSGSILLDSVIRYRATKDYSTSLLSNIASLLEDAVSKKPKIEKIANLVSGYFSVTILSLSVLTFIGWYFFVGDFEKALIVAISVIVIACPCALGLATPMATLVGLGLAAKKGIIFKESSYLETMAKSSLLVLDKTGTITKGKPVVVDFRKFKDFDEAEILAFVENSNHPISVGIAEFLTKRASRAIVVNDFKEVKAKGIKAKIGLKDFIGGKKEFLEENGINIDYEGKDSLFL